MALTYQDVQSSQTYAASGTVTISGASAGDAILVVALVYPYTTTWSASSDLDGALTKDLAEYHPVGNYAIVAFSLLNASSGTHVITVSGTGGTYIAIYAYRVSDVATSSAYDANATATAAGVYGLNVGPTGTLAQADEIAVSLVHGSGDTNFTSPTGWTGATQINDGTFGRRVNAAYKIVSSTAALTADWSGSAITTLEGAVLTYKASGGGGGGGSTPGDGSAIIMVL